MTYMDGVFCGGTVYSPATIITAAHCCHELADGQSVFAVVGGELDITITSGKEQKRSIKSYLSHPEYDEANISNDICLVFLSNDLELNDDVQKIELNKQETIREDTECVVSGWGTTVRNHILSLHFENRYLK